MQHDQPSGFYLWTFFYASESDAEEQYDVIDDALIEQGTIPTEIWHFEINGVHWLGLISLRPDEAGLYEWGPGTQATLPTYIHDEIRRVLNEWASARS